MRRATALVATLAAAALVLAPALAEAAAGGRGSFGSRGSRTYSPPPATSTAPGTAQPMQRSVTQPGTAAPRAAAGQPARSGFMGGMMGGLLGAGLFGLLLGGGLFGGFSGFASVLGFLLQIALVGLLVMFVVRLIARRRQPALAGGPVLARTGAPGHVPMAGAALGGGAAMAATRPVEIGPADYQTFERLLQAIQAAWSAGDEGALRRFTTPEMAGYFGEQLSDQARAGFRNEVRDVKLEQGDLAEAWAEGDIEYATVAMRFSAIDVTRDGSGRVVEGDAALRTMTTEVWTFLRERGGNWVLSAIQQTA